MGFILHIVVDELHGSVGIVELGGEGLGGVQRPGIFPELVQQLQLLLHKHGVAHAQLQLVAGSTERLQEVLESLVDFCLGSLCEVEHETFQDLCQGGATGPQGQEAQGYGDTQRGEDDILIGVLQSQLLIEAEGKVSVAGANEWSSTYAPLCGSSGVTFSGRQWTLEQSPAKKSPRARRVDILSALMSEKQSSFQSLRVR